MLVYNRTSRMGIGGNKPGMPAHKKTLQRAWLYDGTPEYVDLNVGATSSAEGLCRRHGPRERDDTPGGNTKSS
jgi:hypothetical protein